MLDAAPSPAPAGGQGEPPWLTIILSVIGGLVTLGGAYLTYLTTRGKNGNSPVGEDRVKPAVGPPQHQAVQEEPAERYDQKMVLIERYINDQDERLEKLESANAALNQQLVEARAERDRLRWMFEQWAGRPTTSPPTNQPPTPPPPGQALPGQAPPGQAPRWPGGPSPEP